MLLFQVKSGGGAAARLGRCGRRWRAVFAHPAAAAGVTTSLWHLPRHPRTESEAGFVRVKELRVAS